MSIVIGLYDDLVTAQQVVRDLEDNGFPKQDMHLATYDSRAQKREGGGFFDSLSNLFSSEPKQVSNENQGMLRQLTGWGIPEQDAQHYLEAMRRGSTMILVNSAQDMAQNAKSVMDRYDPIDVDERASQWQQQGWQGYDEKARPFNQQDMDRERSQYASNINQGDETRIPTVEEELRVGKRQVNRGGVRVHTTVTEQPIEQTHMVRDETVNVERRQANRPATDADMNAAFKEQSFEVNETDEELITDKQARVTGEVVVSKQVEERPETVRDTVRRTDVQTEDLGAGQTRRTRDFSNFDTDFRNNYDLVYGTRGQDYSYYEPGYRYGYDLAGNERYRGKKWSEIEPNARRDWEQSHPQSKWDDFKDSIRFGWERVTGSGQSASSQDTSTGWTGTDTENFDRGLGTNR